MLQEVRQMKISRLTMLLFGLNLLDALLTIYWVRNGFATEGNGLMAGLLDMGNVPFLTVKTSIGAVAAIMLWRWKDLRIAQYGLTLALTIYVGLMAVHFVTGLSAFGYLSQNFISNVGNWTNGVFALIV